MRKSRSKYLKPILLLVTVMTLFTSGTYAFILSKSEPILNQFILKETGIQLIENGNGTETVQVKNSGVSTVYVRLNLVVQVLDAEGNIITKPIIYDSDGSLTNLPISLENYMDLKHNDTIGFNTDNWVRIENYYYYKTPIEANQTTNVLFDLAMQKEDIIFAQDSQRLSLTILAEAIQANGISDVWKVSLDDNKNIINLADE